MEGDRHCFSWWFSKLFQSQHRFSPQTGRSLPSFTSLLGQEDFPTTPLLLSWVGTLLWYIVFLFYGMIQNYAYYTKQKWIKAFCCNHDDCSAWRRLVEVTWTSICQFASSCNINLDVYSKKRERGKEKELSVILGELLLAFEMFPLGWKKSWLCVQVQKH